MLMAILEQWICLGPYEFYCKMAIFSDDNVWSMPPHCDPYRMEKWQ